MRANWADPVIRAKRVASLKAALAVPETRERVMARAAVTAKLNTYVESGTIRFCKKCVSELTRRDNGQYRCSVCEKARESSPDRRRYNRERAVIRYRNDPEHRRRLKLYSTTQKYGLTPDDLSAMFARQQGKCALCCIEFKTHVEKKRRSFNVDHDHATGAVRGLLCNPCNTGLGHLERLIRHGIHARALAYCSLGGSQNVTP